MVAPANVVRRVRAVKLPRHIMAILILQTNFRRLWRKNGVKSVSLAPNDHRVLPAARGSGAAGFLNFCDLPHV